MRLEANDKIVVSIDPGLSEDDKKNIRSAIRLAFDCESKQIYLVPGIRNVDVLRIEPDAD